MFGRECDSRNGNLKYFRNFVLYLIFNIGKVFSIWRFGVGVLNYKDIFYIFKEFGIVWFIVLIIFMFLKRRK